MFTRFVFFFLVGCGVDPEFQKVRPVVDRNCATCHDGLYKRKFTQANFKASDAAEKIRDGSMPPLPRQLSQADKEALLEYLETGC